ncbi:MAG: hypothetical protein U1E60_22410 [Reyranellaceae bacterium]
MTLLRQFLLVLGLTIAAIEGAGLIIGNNGYFWNARQLYLSTGALRPIGPDGLWTYAPDREIVSAATYRLSAIEGWVEYYCRFRTNKFGLLDTNYDADRHAAVDYLVLGDSFLEGQGGCPWLVREALPENLPIVINAGLQGASIRGMEVLEDWLGSQVAIRNIAMLVISNDFKRTPIPGIWTSRPGCLLEGKCEPGLDYVWAIPPDVTQPRLAGLSVHIPDASNRGLWAQIVSTLAYHSFSFDIIRRLAGIAGVGSHRLTDDEEKAFAINFAALRRLHAKFPAMKLVLVPQRDEVGFFGVENRDTARVRQFLADQGIAYQLCPLGLADYMPIDGHPNRGGYAKLYACLERALR